MSALPSSGRADHAVLGADATRTLYERHGRRIFAFCYSRLGSREEAEDATQTTFLNAFRSLRGGVVPAFELAWLFRIADNVCRDRRKSAWRRNRFEAVRDLDELQDVVAAPENGSDGLAGLDDALASMPERQRRAILLREWQGLSYGEIAEELGVSRAAVETLIFRARRSLARGLEAPQSRRRVGLDLSSVFAFAKALFSGGGAVKAAAVVAGAGLIAAAPLRDSERQRSQASTPRPAVASAPSASEAGAPPPSILPTRAVRRDHVVVAGERSPRAGTGAGTRSIPRARSVPSGAAAKTAPPRSDPASGPDARPQSPPSGAPPASTPPPPAAETPVATPPAAAAPPLPELPPVPEVPKVEPPLPEVPDLPVDVPDVPPLPPLP